MYGFNHEEAIVCFEKALAADPGCVMAHWGIAHAIGPNYNKVWEFFRPDERGSALARAHQALADARRPGEGDADGAGDWSTRWRTAFPPTRRSRITAPGTMPSRQSMRKVYADFPDDLDVAAIFAEALMNRTPWKLWDLPARKPADGASTVEAQAVLERAFATHPEAWDHPGLLHMYIHLMEMSPTPEQALPHGDRLVDLVPDSGHLVHMATHIDVLCGDYQNVVWRNHRAARSTASIFAHAGGENFYTIYRIHNLHFEMYGAMFLARPTPALAAAEALRETLPEPVVRYHAAIVRGLRGDEGRMCSCGSGGGPTILDEPFPEDRRSLQLHDRDAALRAGGGAGQPGRLDEAEAERAAFWRPWLRVQDDRMMFNNPCSEVLKVAEQMMLGELAYKSGGSTMGWRTCASPCGWTTRCFMTSPGAGCSQRGTRWGHC